jgi:hypothetical protein
VVWCLQLNQDIEEVGPEALVVEVLAEVLCDLDGLVLRQLGGAGNVQEQSTQLGERRLFVSATGRGVIVAAALGSATVVTTVVVVSVICDAVSTVDMRKRDREADGRLDSRVSYTMPNATVYTLKPFSVSCTACAWLKLTITTALVVPSSVTTAIAPVVTSVLALILALHLHVLVRHDCDKVS